MSRWTEDEMLHVDQMDQDRRKYRDVAAKLEEALTVIWPHAIDSASAGGSGGPEMREMRYAADLVRDALGDLPDGCDDPGTEEDDEP